MLNKIMLIGRLGKDPELRYIASGNAVCNFSLATTEKWKKDGAKQEKTTWHNIVIWGKLGEVAGKYLKKGSLCYLEGAVDNRSYEDKQGVKKYISEVIAQKMTMLDSKGSSEHGDDDQRTPDDSGDQGQHASDMDLPF
jgi:single-strand DNA-binding protein